MEVVLLVQRPPQATQLAVPAVVVLSAEVAVPHTATLFHRQALGLVAQAARATGSLAEQAHQVLHRMVPVAAVQGISPLVAMRQGQRVAMAAWVAAVAVLPVMVGRLARAAMVSFSSTTDRRRDA